jgi:glycosyltransferase involved in cell wall biosynthesis
MACGTPVVTSRISSLPEVVGDAALLVDPYSVEDIAGRPGRVLETTS